MPLMADMGRNILFRAFCALADGAVSPIQSTLKHFMGEYEAHVREGRCPVTGIGPGSGAQEREGDVTFATSGPFELETAQR